MVASTFSQVTIGNGSTAVGAPSTLIVTDSGREVLVYNTSTTNAVWFTSNNAFTSGDAGTTGTSPLAPLSSIVFDGTENIYAVCAPGQSAVVNLYPTAISFVPQTQLTALISEGSLTGTPSGIIIPAGGSVNILTLADVTSFASYDLNCFLIDLNQNLANGALTAKFTLQWFDDLTTGISVFEEDWEVWVSNSNLASTSLNPLAGNGPMHGKYMSVMLSTPPACVNNVNVQYIDIFGSPRTVPYSDWRQKTQAFNINSNGFVSINGNTGANLSYNNIIGSLYNAAIGVNALNWMPLGLYAGSVYYRIRVGAQPLTNGVNIACASQLVSGQVNVGSTGMQNILVDLPFAANMSNTGNLILPRAPCLLSWKGNGSAGTTLDAVITALQTQ